MKNYFNKFIFGADYNPEQWPENIWEEDYEFMKKARMNTATINVFSWAKLQPDENTFNFEELDKIIYGLKKNDIKIIFATPTAAAPAWLFRKYPEIARVDFYGRRHRFGKRQFLCPSSTDYQNALKRIVEKVIKRYHDEKSIICWHINNEYGGKCFCPSCEKNFRIWLKEKYGDLYTLNQAWNSSFWSRNIYDWGEIVVPNELSVGKDEDNGSFESIISIDYSRFQSDITLKNFLSEKEIIRKYDQKRPVTTNLMGTYRHLDYFKWAKHMDIVSWDSYPAFDTPPNLTAMNHDLMRGLKDQPFMLMEQSPSQSTWQIPATVKEPGIMRAQSYQAIAHGANSVQFFQFRRSTGGCEKFHGAIIDHVSSSNTRIFKEVAGLGRELTELDSDFLGSNIVSNVAMIFDWDTYWALIYLTGMTDRIDYIEQLHTYYSYFYEKNISIDIISKEQNLRKYDLILAPFAYMISSESAQKLEQFVSHGGTLVTSCLSGIVNSNDKVYMGGYPGPLRRLTGVWVEEIAPLPTNQIESITFHQSHLTGKVSLIADYMTVDTANIIATYNTGYFKNHPAVTANVFGDGKCYYVGGIVDQNSLSYIFDHITKEKNISPVLNNTSDLEISKRSSNHNDYYIAINHKSYDIAPPQEFIGQINLINNKIITADALHAKEILIIKKERKN